MAESSLRFNRDSFSEWLAESADVLAENELLMGERPELPPLADGSLRPGEIGGVLIQLTFNLDQHPTLFDPDDAA